MVYFFTVKCHTRVSITNELLTDHFPTAGIPTTTAKPTGYSVRMEASVPLANQPPPIQPLQIRPGVITQVKWIGAIQVTLTVVIRHGWKLASFFFKIVNVV